MPFAGKNRAKEYVLEKSFSKNVAQIADSPTKTLDLNLFPDKFKRSGRGFPYEIKRRGSRARRYRFANPVNLAGTRQDRTRQARRAGRPVGTFGYRARKKA